MVSGMFQTALNIGCDSVYKTTQVQAKGFLQSNSSGCLADTCDILKAKTREHNSCSSGLGLTF